MAVRIWNSVLLFLLSVFLSSRSAIIPGNGECYFYAVQFCCLGDFLFISKFSKNRFVAKFAPVWQPAVRPFLLLELRIEVSSFYF